MHRRTVFIVDDDPAVRDAVSLLLSLRGHATANFASAEDFLRVVEPGWQGCALVDIRMPGMTGLELQRALRERAPSLPVVIITGHGDIQAARQAFQASAVDFLEKPFDEGRLMEALAAAWARLPEEPVARGPAARPATLSAREREVLDLVVDGLDNHAVGERLGISPRTVEVHKSRLMAKLGARNLAELLRIAGARASRA